MSVTMVTEDASQVVAGRDRVSHFSIPVVLVRSYLTVVLFVASNVAAPEAKPKRKLLL